MIPIWLASDLIMPNTLPIEMTKTWGIIGLGWLGSELAKAVSGAGDLCWGTRSAEFDMTKDSFPSAQCDILFLNMPPLVGIKPKEFVGKIVLGETSKIIFISSTSVYGENTGRITEESRPIPKTKNGHWLLDVEAELKRRFADRLCIVRPGGLIGGERHPVRYLSGRSSVADGNLAINLIHRTDLINIILYIARSNQNWPIVNAVASNHCRKDKYYTEWAHKLKLTPPIFFESNEESRVIESVFLPKIYPNWVCPNLDFI